MTSSRETIYAALFAQFASLSGINKATRRLQEYSQVGIESEPALFMLQRREIAHKLTGVPTKWTLNVELYIYVNTGNDLDNTIPAQVINPIMDTLEAALEPSSGTFYQTLGTLGVTEARISGPVEIVEGVKGAEAEVMIPIEVIVT